MKTLYQCDICKKIYDDHDKAEDCEAKGVETPVFKVGDFVLAGRYNFGWNDGNPDWVYEKEPGKGLRGGVGYTLIYVVVGILPYERDAHYLAYYLATDAMTGVKGWREGWKTCYQSWTAIVKIDRPDLAEQAAALVAYYAENPQELTEFAGL